MTTIGLAIALTLVFAIFFLYPMKRAIRGMTDALGLVCRWYHLLPHCPYCKRRVMITFRDHYWCAGYIHAYPGLLHRDRHDLEVAERRLANGGATCGRPESEATASS